jgi:hypothetical protein
MIAIMKGIVSQVNVNANRQMSKYEANRAKMQKAPAFRQELFTFY